MKDEQVDPYVAANFDNFWKKYDNNGSGEIYESEAETFMRALLGPNNRFRLAPGALSDMKNAAQYVNNEFTEGNQTDYIKFNHSYAITPVFNYTANTTGAQPAEGADSAANAA